MKKCKYCEKEGIFSFGWLDMNNEWRDKHLTCPKHFRISVLQQEFSSNMEALRERCRRFGSVVIISRFNIGA